MLGGDAVPCMTRRPCDRMRLIPDGVDEETGAALEAFVSLRILHSELPAAAPAYAQALVDGAPEPVELLWRLEYLARFAARLRADDAGSS